ncbi:MAG: hypothetical protein ABIR32_07975 [Ilumatobacteraceae bacterium]
MAIMRRLPSSLLSITVLTTLGVSALGLTSCGSDENKTATTSGPAVPAGGPEELVVDDATVTAGLARLPATIQSAIAAIGTPDAKAKLDQIEAEWFSFEGAVRFKDRDLYLAIEDDLSPLQTQIASADTDAAQASAVSLNDLFAQYLAKHP